MKSVFGTKLKRENYIAYLYGHAKSMPAFLL